MEVGNDGPKDAGGSQHAAFISRELKHTSITIVSTQLKSGTFLPESPALRSKKLIHNAL